MAEFDNALALPEPTSSRRAHRDVEDDFFCLRFQVWYPSKDCAIRTKFRTCGGCLDCDQGRFNLKRHAASLRGYRFPATIED